MRTFLTESNYWQELEKMELPARAKDMLKGVVSAYLTNTIPPSVTNSDITALQESGITKIHLSRQSHEELLELTVFLPYNPTTNNRFIYLRKYYPNGTNTPISKLAKS